MSESMLNIISYLVASVAVTLITTFFIPWLSKQIGVANAKKAQSILETEILTQEKVKSIITEAVRYVEQVNDGEKSGQFKKGLVLGIVKEKIGSINLSEEELSIKIEAVLRELKDEFGEDWGISSKKTTKKTSAVTTPVTTTQKTSK